MKANEALMRAIGEIDEDIIAEASLPYKKPVSFGKIGAVAAAIALTVSITVGAGLVGGGLKGSFLPSFSGGSGAAGAPGENDSMGDDGADVTAKPELIYMTVQNGEHSFLLKIPSHLTADRIDIVFLAVGENEVYAATDLQTDVIYCDTVCIKEDGVSITVDGEETDTLPTDYGLYEIRADLSDFIERHGECILIWKLYVDGEPLN